MKRVNSLSQLRNLISDKKSVFCPNTFAWKKPRPAAFMINLSGTTILVCFLSGMYVYEKKFKDMKLNENYDDLIPLSEFNIGINCTLFTDGGGYGFYSDGIHYDPENKVVPSKYLLEDPPTWATHVLWFNK